MIPRNSRNGAAVALPALLLGGCATKGYVNDRIAEVDSRHATELDRVRETASGARELGDSAVRGAAEARDLALGNVDWQEVAQATVRFEFDSAELSEAARAELSRVSQKVAASRRARVDIYGYTDTIGSERYNDVLSSRRADAVLRHLLQTTDAPLTRFTIVGLGETAPIGEGETEDHEAGRRVMVSVLEAVPPQGAKGETQLSQADAAETARQ